MSDSKVYIILAGLDGIGKTTLTTVAPELFYEAKKVNSSKVIQLDTKALSQGRKHPADKNSLASELKNSLAKNESVYYETTLVHSAKIQRQLLNEAKKAGYRTILYYIDTYDLETIYSRNMENNRMNSFEKIEEDFNNSHNHLFELMLDVDEVIIFDNTEHFDIIQIKWN